MSLEYLQKNKVLKSALLFSPEGAIAVLIGLFALTVCSFLVFGCATLPKLDIEAVPVDHFQPYASPEGESIFPKSVDADIPNVDILALSDDVKALLDESITPIKNRKKRLYALVEVLIDKVRYDAENDRYGTRTAQETYDAGTANCLSFSNLFVAMARYVGLSVQFQEVPTPPNWIRTGEALFFTHHIGALIDVYDSLDHTVHLGFGEADRIVVWNNAPDQYFFSPSNLGPFGAEINPRFGRPIADHCAFAQYYNNIGSQYLAEGNSSDAFRYFVKAIKVDPGLSFAWSNLGVVYSRNNQLRAAEAAFLQGLNAIQRQDDTTALNIMNNMVKLYERSGDKEKAEFYLKEVESHREKNPYYLYALAKTFYHEASYEKSVKYFKAAIRRKDDDHLFYYGLALAYFKLGDLEGVEENIDKARYYAWDEGKKAYYDRLRDTLVNSMVSQ
jgi:tetratricopeptide (TPR) repeat protein